MIGRELVRLGATSEQKNVSIEVNERRGSEREIVINIIFLFIKLPLLLSCRPQTLMIITRDSGVNISRYTIRIFCRDNEG